MIPTYVFTNDNHLHLLKGFSYLWNEYSDPATVIGVVGYSEPDFKLPNNFVFHSLGKQQPKERWSNSLIQFCNLLDSDYFILMLEDYWFIDHVDRLVIPKLVEWIKREKNVLRMDLSGNRAAYPSKIVGKCMDYTIIESLPSAKYMMSFQAAIWHRKNMLRILREYENPWQAEIEGSKRVQESDLRVLGTDLKIMNYQPVWRSQQRKWQLDKIPTYQLEKIKSEGWLE